LKNKDAENSFVSNIYWRPFTHNFIFIKEYHANNEGDEGDFGLCTINYAYIELSERGIYIKKIDHGKPQVSTTLGWSSDGKYYAYSEPGNIIIRNFNTGKSWVARSFDLDNGGINFNLYDMGSFLWVDHDQKLAFSWKRHPFYDEPSGIAVIDIKQFGLN
jgi:hypothetical protein